MSRRVVDRAHALNFFGQGDVEGRRLPWWLAVFLALALFGVTREARAQSFAATGSLATARFGHTATLLPSGQVLVAGGQGNGVLGSAELYVPKFGNQVSTWSAAGSLAVARTLHTATLLQSGQVLVAGGEADGNAAASAELYDPSTNTWSAAASLAAGRYEHTATLLPSGQVLVAGGEDSNGTCLASAEIYNPATGVWSAAGSLVTARQGHTATLLQSGRVIVAGGVAPGDVTLGSAELYNPATSTWSAAGSLVTPRLLHTATLLQTGQVLVAAGLGSDTGGTLGSAEVYTQGPIVAVPAPALPMWAMLLLAAGILGVMSGSPRRRPPSVRGGYFGARRISPLTLLQ